MLHRRVASRRGVEIFASLLAFDNYVPSQNYGGWFASERERARERESCEAVFSSLGAFVLRGQENSAGKIIFLPHSSSLLRRCTQQPGWRRLCCSSVIVSIDSHRFPPLALCPFLFAIESWVYPIVRPYLLRLIIEFLSANIRRSFAPRYYTSIDYCSHLRSIIVRVYPSIAFAFTILASLPVSLFVFCPHSSVFILGLSRAARFMKVGDMGLFASGDL